MEDGDVPSVIQMAREVAFKLSIFSRSLQALVTETCKVIFPQVLMPGHSVHVKEYFECVEGCLNHAKDSGDSSILVAVFQVLEKAYSACSEK